MTARVTFGNINGHTEPAPHVSLHMEQKRVEPPPETTPTAHGEVEMAVKHRHTQAHTDTAQGYREEEGEEGEEEEEGEKGGTPARCVILLMRMG